MGVSAFLEQVNVAFVCGLQTDDVPLDIDWNDRDALAHWLQEGFALWLLTRRDEVMAEEWFHRGWAEMVVAPDAAGRYQTVYRVLSDRVEQIESWLEDAME